MQHITVYGTEWCSDCQRSKTLLDDNNIPYTWIDISNQTEYRDYVKTLNNGYESVPTIVFEDGSILVEPSDKDLSIKLGI